MTAATSTDADVDPVGYVDVRIRFGPAKHRMDFKTRVTNRFAISAVIALDLLLVGVALGLSVLLNVIYR